MINVVDRVSKYPGRVRLVPVEGQPNVFDMVRADEPTVEGTLLNAEFFNELGDGYMAATNPTGTGSFSMNRLSGSVVGDYSHAEGKDTTASATGSHAEGRGTAKGVYSHAEGSGTANGSYSHVEGNGTTTIDGAYSHAEGDKTTASNTYAHAEGYYTTASSSSSHAEGTNTTASGQASHAEGWATTASGHHSHAEGNNTTALHAQHAQGHFNNTTTATGAASVSVTGGTGTNTAFVIGNGTKNATSNAFRVDYNGVPYSKSALTTTGCDYAEFFEWLDGNPDAEDRRGYFVTMDGEKIKIAEPSDYILGIVSGHPSVIGNGDEDWMGRYIMDDFGDYIYEDFEYEEEVFDEESGEMVKITRTGKHYKMNPDYDESKGYIQRSERPEWAAIGMLGVLSVIDDGTCQVNGFCTIAEGGTATAAESGYRVIKRVNDHIVKAVFK